MQDPQIAEARAKLAQKFGESVRIGGKGTQRRKKKTVHKSNVNEDKKLKQAIKRFGVQPLQDIDEVNMFKEDSSVLHFKKPFVQFAVRENLLVVTGAPESKQLTDLLPGILKQVGPKQYEFLKKFAQSAKGGETIAEEKEEDEVPDLVGGNFDDIANKD